MHAKKILQRPDLATKVAIARSSLRSCQLSLCMVSAFASQPLAVQAAGSGSTDGINLHFVTTCDDDGPGSLRDALAAALSGDSIVLDELACSTITLTTGPLQVNQDDIYIGGATTITAEGRSRIFEHLTYGVLNLGGLVIRDGRSSGQYFAGGGCIYSRGGVTGFDITVQDCVAELESLLPGRVSGGGIFSAGDINLTKSIIEGNSAIAATSGDIVIGGGLYSRANIYNIVR